MSTPTRLSLIDELKATENDDAWQQFSSMYGELILYWLQSKGVQLADAEDVRQEVLAVVLSEIQSFNHNGRQGAFRSWLRKLTSNRLHRLWEKKSIEDRRVSSVDLSAIAEQLADDNSRLSHIWHQEHDEFILQQLLRLIGKSFDSKTVDAFRRVAIDLRPASDVADELGMTLGAVRVAQHRVLKALKARAKEIVD